MTRFAKLCLLDWAIFQMNCHSLRLAAALPAISRVFSRGAWGLRPADVDQ